MKITSILLIIALAASLLPAQSYSPSWESLDSRPTPQWFIDAKFGIFIHWGVYAVPSWGPKDHYAENYAHHLYTVKRDVEVNFHNRVYGADFSYRDFGPMFKAELFDAQQWADVFKRSGAQYVVITSKHTDSYALWPAPDTKSWNSVEIGPKRNILQELVNKVRGEGLRIGFYYCLLEWYHPYSTLYKENVNRYVETRMLPQLKDLVSSFQPDILWGDGEWDFPDSTWHTPEFLCWLFNESPVRETIAINDRWGQDSRHKHGGYYTPEYGAGFADDTHPWEENRAMGHSYGYNRNETLDSYRSTRELIHMLADIVSRGGNLLLDIGPKADGRIPVIMEERLMQIGQWLQVNGEAIYGTKPWKDNCQWSAGEKPKMDIGKDYMGHYEISEITGEPRDGKAVVEVFFTVKANNIFATTPRWPGKKLQMTVPKPVAVTLLGSDKDIPFTYNKDRLVLDLSGFKIGDLPCQYAWCFKIKL
ncbi:alpha-L-fucosidase [candidate division KSB1 bacterium]|nr:alpha-L-fucosidase [candidate division KSB1 bacterium]